jgi:D-serine deaminase-like pyridoxal phosphate-dependent protein
MPVKPLHIPWVQPALLEDIPSPALVLGLDVVQENLRRMAAMAGDVTRLRPHVKTHKLPWLVQMQLDVGIEKYKCATIAEAEMCAKAGATSVLLAYQMVGPNVGRFLTLQRKFPATEFLTLVDDAGAWRALGEAARLAGLRVETLLDLDVGQHRTGIPPGPEALAAYEEMSRIPSLIPGGLHAYDGHLCQPNPSEREAACADAFAPVFALRAQLLAKGLSVPRLVAGGSPTFPFHARRGDVECSPGTVVLWDAGSAAGQPDLDFSCAAVVLTRVVSKPGPDLLCLDLGHKALAAEMPPPRAIFPALPDPEVVKHSEEHLLLRTPEAGAFAVGDKLLAAPWHICPTVALHAEAVLVEQGRVTGTWPIEARARKLTI